jgi:excisionase family DNA binding protein
VADPSDTPRTPASIKQAAQRGGVHPDTIRRRIADGSLRAWRFGPQQLRVDLDDVDVLFRRVPTVGAA